MVMLGQLQQTIRNFSKIKTIKKYGVITKHEHKYVGFNSRLDTIQATILLKINFKQTY